MTDTGHVTDSSLLQCLGCGRLTWPETWKWREYRFDELEIPDEPEEPVYCPDCAEQKFG